MKNIDEILVTPNLKPENSCVSRVQVAKHFFEMQGHEVTEKVGTLWVWHEGEQRYDTVHDFHCWMWLSNMLWDSFGGLKRALNILDRAGEGFGKLKPIEEWKAFELSVPEILDGSVRLDNSSPAILSLLHKYRSQFGYDAIFVEGLVMPNWQNDIEEIKAQIKSEPVFE